MTYCLLYARECLYILQALLMIKKDFSNYDLHIYSTNKKKPDQKPLVIHLARSGSTKIPLTIHQSLSSNIDFPACRGIRPASTILSPYTHAHSNIFKILLNQTEIRLYLLFSD